MDFLNPEQVLNQIDLKEGMTAADFGCGAGGWALPLAKKLRTGKVYAVDIQAEALAALRAKIEMVRANNIRPIQADLTQGLGSSIQSGLLDLVLLTNLLFQIEDKDQILKEAKRVLREGGQLLVTDWKTDSPFGPSEKRISAAEGLELIEKAGFQIEKELRAGQYHWALLFHKV
ncbi:MAG: methyltransferase domain-containing protein [Candidatus Nealsonbacteria bacterium]|nr:methyltransferase domain-containing protein [Candidatus Nealsonbacteria bacterium]